MFGMLKKHYIMEVENRVKACIKIGAAVYSCQTDGALFASEDSYYGESMPVNIKGTSSLKYLSAGEALAELAALINAIKSAPEFKSSKVVVIGGSYPGNLAAWMRVL